MKLDAARLNDFAALVSRVAPGKFSRLLVARADSLSPARATLEARREGEAKPGPFPLDFLTADGEAGGTHFSMKINNAPAPVNAIGVDMSLDAAEGGALLKQLGLRSPANPMGRARAALNATGDWTSGFDGNATASLTGADFSASGRFAPENADPSAAILFGKANLKSDNAMPLLSALHFAATTAGFNMPVDLSADVVVRGDQVAAPRLTGTLGGCEIRRGR